MKRIYIVSSVILLLVCSCVKSGNGEDIPTAGLEYIDVPNKVDIQGEETSASITISASDNCNWTVSCSDPLVSNISPTSGRGDGNVTITTTVNPTSLSSRSATINVKNSDGTIERSIPLTQFASKEFIELSLESIEFSKNSEIRDVTISSNTRWTITGGANWITISKTEGEDNDVFSITVDENTSYDKREAVLTIKGAGGTSKSINIKQAETIFTTLSVPQISNVTKSSATVSFTFDSNVVATTYGVCYSTKDNPTIEDATVISNEGTSNQGNPSIELKDLTAGTTYYLRAYVVNIDGVKYSNSIKFVTANSWPGGDDNITPNI